MPKIVDHDKRREEVLDATWRVISRVGLQDTTTRRIADEAGYSNGALAHYFKNKDAILAAAHQLAFSHAGERIRKAAHNYQGVELLRQVLFEALPLDDESILEARVDITFVGHSVGNPETGRIRGESFINSRPVWREIIEQVRATGELTTTEDIEILIDEAQMLIDSLSMQHVIAPTYMTPERQKLHVERLLTRWTQ